MFKSDLGQEEYLTFNISKYQRSLFAQFRGGILPLQVEIGRYRNLPLEQRICTLCDRNEVEDEFHLLCHCPIYEDIRKVLYNETITLYPDFTEMDDLQLFVFLVSKVKKQVINFLTTAYFRRRAVLFK